MQEIENASSKVESECGKYLEDTIDVKQEYQEVLEEATDARKLTKHQTCKLCSAEKACNNSVTQCEKERSEIEKLVEKGKTMSEDANKKHQEKRIFGPFRFANKKSIFFIFLK